MNKKDLRAVVLVPYNLSPIQQGIQAAHSIVELQQSVQGDEFNKYKEWAKHYKTIIILNAGTTGKFSSMENHIKNLKKLKVDFATFREPDLNNALTAVAFVLDYKEDTHIVGYLKQMRLA